MKYPSAAKTFGVRLRQIREERGLSQQELADLADLTRVTITRFENAKMNATLEALVGIAKGLEIHMRELLDFDIPKEPKKK